MGIFDRIKSSKAADTPEALTEKLLGGRLLELMRLNGERRGNSIYVPCLGLSVTPRVTQLQKYPAGHSAVLEFDMWSDKWEMHFFEQSAGTAASASDAVDNAAASFVFSFIQGMSRAVGKDEPIRVKNDLADTERRFDVYLSNMTCTSPKEAKETASAYWSALSEGITARLGGQRLTYVKIFNSNIRGDITAECRINDIPVPELSSKLAVIAEGWDSSEWRTEKQFFFIEQSEDTYVPGEYTGKDGRELMKQRVIKYLEMFRDVRTQDDYDTLLQRAGEAMGDMTLAEECFAFLPEMTASHIFVKEIESGDKFLISYPDDREYTVYRSQLSDYDALDSISGEVLLGDTFGDSGRQLLGRLAASSAIYGVIQQIPEDKKDDRLVLSSLAFNVSDDFEIR